MLNSQFTDNNKINCLIIDFNKSDLNSLKCTLEKLSIFNTVVIANEFQEAGYFLSLNTFDVIFLNILLINQKKYEIIDELINKTKLVCYSSNPSDAKLAYDICAKDFFTLPINIDRIQKSIFRVISGFNFENIKNQKLIFKTGKNSLYINENEIQYIEAYGNYIKIYSNENIHIILEKISTIENRLSKNLFLRVHRSYIINKNFISFKKNDHLVLSNNKIIPLGNTYKASINNL